MNTRQYIEGQILAHKDTHKNEDNEGRKSFLSRLLKKFPGKVGTLLEIGCHNGMETKELLDYAEVIHGIELGRGYVEAAVARGLEGFYPRVMDMHKLEYNNGFFDAVFANNVVEHAHDPKRVLREVHRVLKPGGFMLSAIPPDNCGTHIVDLEYHMWKAYPEEIHEMLDSVFDVVSSEEWAVPELVCPNSDWKMVVSVCTKA